MTEIQTVTAIPVNDTETSQEGQLTAEEAEKLFSDTEGEEDDDDTFLPEDLETKEDTFAFVELFDVKCMNCKALVPFATKNYKGCHFTQGNEHCPAASVKIVVRIPLEKIVTKFLNAERTGDNQKLARLYAHLGTKESWYQERVNEALIQARKAPG